MTADGGHVGSLQKIHGQVGRVVDLAIAGAAAEVTADVGEDVEGAVGHSQTHVGDLAAEAADQVAPTLEGHAHLLDTRLVAGEGFAGGFLRNAAGPRGVLTLQLAGGPGQPQRGGQEANAPAGHGVGFGDAIDDGHAVAQHGEGGDAGVAADVVDVLVDLVGDDDHLRVTRQDVGQGLQLVVAVDAARGVRGRAEDERLGLGRDGGLELLGRDLEVLIDAGGQDHVRALGQLDHLHVAHPVGGGHDDFVARVDEAEQGVADGLLGAVGDDDLIDGVVEAVLPLEFGDDGLPQV